MPALKISLTRSELESLTNEAEAENLAVQDYIRKELFNKPAIINIFTPQEAERRAIEKFTTESELFSIADIYGDRWVELEPRMTGIFCKRVFKATLQEGSRLAFVKRDPYGRRALYKLKEEETEL